MRLVALTVSGHVYLSDKEYNLLPEDRYAGTTSAGCIIAFSMQLAMT